MADIKKTEKSKELQGNTNPLKIPFPQDPQGVLKDLRVGGVKAAGRAAGSDESYDKFVETTKLLLEYAEAKHAFVKADRAKARENAKNAALRVAQKQAAIADEKLNRLIAAAKVAREVAKQKAAEVEAYTESKE